MTTMFDPSSPIISDAQIDPASLAAADLDHAITNGYTFADFRVVNGVIYVRSLRVAESIGYKRGCISEKKFRKLEGAVRLMHHGYLSTFVPVAAAEDKLERCRLFGANRAAAGLQMFKRTVDLYRSMYATKAQISK